jgi:Raf kinase inhibitor-like YbhB/YbcL family protein
MHALFSFLIIGFSVLYLNAMQKHCISTNSKEPCPIENTIASFNLKCDKIKSGIIIDRFTPQGEDVNPEIYWDKNSVPEGTKSFAFAVEDPDAPSGTFYHWLVINIPASIDRIKENSKPGTEIENSWEIKQYKGPRPPKGTTHRYYFKLFALSIEKISANDISSFYEEVYKYKLGEADLLGTYSR